MITSFRNIGCRMSLKLHYLDSHIDRFSFNLGSLSEEPGERFHQDIKHMEFRYQGGYVINMIADYIWNLKIESDD